MKSEIHIFIIWQRMTFALNVCVRDITEGSYVG